MSSADVENQQLVDELDGSGSFNFEIHVLDEDEKTRVVDLLTSPDDLSSPSGRPNYVNRGKWDEAKLKRYTEFLVFDLLDLDPETNPSIPLYQYIRRASRIGLGPSEGIFYNFGLTAQKLESQLGFAVNRRVGSRWSSIEIIDQANSVWPRGNGPLTANQVDRLSAEGKLCAVGTIRANFGSLRRFNELNGWPWSKNSNRDDVVEWAAAFTAQNGLDKVSYRIMSKAASKLKGPQPDSIYSLGLGIKPLNSEIIAKRQEIRRYHYDVDPDRYSSFLESVGENGLPAGLYLPDDTPRVSLQRKGLYVLATHLGIPPDESLTEARRMFLNRSVVGLLRRADADITLLELEELSHDLGVGDDIWLKYKFERSDLRVKV